MERPKPFLGPLFQPGAGPVIATGFEYTPQEVAVHGDTNKGYPQSVEEWSEWKESLWLSRGQIG